MNNETCTVTIADIYGAEWWERNKAELDREWEWGFGKVRGGDIICDKTAPSIEEFRWPSDTSAHFRIILHRRKPKTPTLLEVYGVDEVTIPLGWEWTGEWRVPETDNCYRSQAGQVASSFGSMVDPRLILRERQKKVWFKAEVAMRCPKRGDWMWCEVGYQWELSEFDFKERSVLCATRHEEVDQTVQVVTQAMVDEVASHA
jgi:hypothetical protein